MTPYDAPMSGSAAAAAERYLRTFDRMAVDDGALDELMALFSDDATVQFSEEQEPLEGRATLREVYGGFGAQLADSRHFWTLEAAGDRAVLVRWLQGSRWTDGRLVARSGEEVVTVDDGGLITSLRNRRTTPDQGR